MSVLPILLFQQDSGQYLQIAQGDVHQELYLCCTGAFNLCFLKHKLNALYHCLQQAEPSLSALLELLWSGDLKEKACWHTWSSSWTSLIFPLCPFFSSILHQQSRLLLFEDELPRMSLALAWKHIFFTHSLKKCICNEMFGVQELCVVAGLNLCWIPNGLFLSHDLRAIWGCCTTPSSSEARKL